MFAMLVLPPLVNLAHAPARGAHLAASLSQETSLAIGQVIRKRIEEAFGWRNIIAGLGELHHRGLSKVQSTPRASNTAPALVAGAEALAMSVLGIERGIGVGTVRQQLPGAWPPGGPPRCADEHGGGAVVAAPGALGASF
jgi:hypothetical protein